MAGTVTCPFRSVDLDGDGIPDEPQALTAVNGVGGVIAAGPVDGTAASLFKTTRFRQRAADTDQPQTEYMSPGAE